MKAVSKSTATKTKIFAERRKRFIARMLPESVAIIVSNPERIRSNDTEYAYRQSSDILYLCDFPEPQTVLILSNIDKKRTFIMLVRPKDRKRELWTGKRYGAEGAKSKFKPNEAHSIDQFPALLSKLLREAENVYYKYGCNEEFDQQFKTEWVKTSLPLHNPEGILHDMRILKSADELTSMRSAANISAEAHCHAMKICKAGMMEYQIQAEMERIFLMKGAKSPAYTSIVAAGANAITLHYIENSSVLKNGDLLLIDAACEYGGYASDITRTFPVNGRFSAPQEEIYELVLQSQLAVIKAAKPGVSLAELHKLACNVLRKGLVALGVLGKEMRTEAGEMKTVEKAKKNGKSAKHVVLRDLYMHGTSHWLGLDVHDVGTIGTRSQYLKTIPLKPGMVFTVEPALYFDPEDKRLPKRYRGIGVRIEDDVLITRSGCEVLTSRVPKTVKEIEDLMENSAQRHRSLTVNGESHRPQSIVSQRRKNKRISRAGR
jgi:Xaa-Pro aminopeptidase